MSDMLKKLRPGKRVVGNELSTSNSKHLFGSKTDLGSVSDSDNESNDGRRPSIFETKLGEMLKTNRTLVQALAHIENQSQDHDSTSSDDDEHVDDDNTQFLSRQSQVEHSEQNNIPSSTSDDESYWSQLVDRISLYGMEIMDALSETNEDIQVFHPAPKTLNVNELRKNSKRCLAESRPYFEALAGFKEIFTWKRPLSSLMLMFVYVYCVVNGWFVSLVLFLILIQLITNYLTHIRGVSLGLTFLPTCSLPPVSLDKAGAQLVVDISRTVQHILQILADVMEKIRNLLLWKRPETTAYLFSLVLFWFILSLFLSSSSFWTVVGLGIGGKLFITSYFFHRFPRLLHKWDVIVWFFDRLPTHRQLKEGAKYGIVESPSSPMFVSPIVAKSNHIGSHSDEKAHGDQTRRSVVETFEIEDREQIRYVRKCFLMDRSQGFPYAAAGGTLYLTDHYILFKYGKSTSKPRVKFHLSEILCVKKAHSIGSFMPGSGRAINMFVVNRDKPYSFAGMGKRDECYDLLLYLGNKIGATFTQIQIQDQILNS